VALDQLGRALGLPGRLSPDFVVANTDARYFEEEQRQGLVGVT
jgi:hypothetical protein